MSKHSNGHIIEMSKSFALESIRGLHLFEYRLLNELLEDIAFGDKFFRDDIDFHCFLNQCRQLERAIKMGCDAWVRSKEKKELQNSLVIFKNETPYLSPIRNTYEHFDDYLLQKGKNKTIDTRGMRVYSVEYEKTKVYKKKWFDFEVDIKQTISASDDLYNSFLKLHNSYLKNHKGSIM
jgi:hypothetical protein